MPAIDQSKRFAFKVEEIPLSGIDLRAQLDSEWLAPLLPLAYTPADKPALFTGRLDRVGDSLLFNGTLEFSARYLCSRCAEGFVHEGTARMNGLYAPEEKNRTRLDDLEMDDLEDEALDDMFFYDNGIVDLEDQVANAVTISLEPFPICREECKGLCPHCGADLNVAPCKCGPEMDLRFASLAALLKEKTGKSGADKE